jgi:Ca-activated chloride channel family protein
LDVTDHYRQQVRETSEAGDSHAERGIVGDLKTKVYDFADTGAGATTSTQSMGAPQASAPGTDVGMATGGGKDAANFRDNIREGYVPLPDSMAYEGLFYDYYFDTGTSHDEGDSLFYPSYSMAVTASPLGGTWNGT